MFTVLGMVAEMERGFIKARQREGIAKAKAKEEKVYKGGKARIDASKVLNLKQAGNGPTAIAREMGISRMQVHRILKADGDNVA